MAKHNKYKARFINFRKIIYDLIRWHAWPIFLYFRVKKYYVNKETKKHLKKGGLIIANHLLYSDPMVLHCAFWFRRLHFVVAKDIMESKLSYWFFHQCGCIPIDRDQFSMSSLRVIVDTLKGGNLVAIFPEGHVGLSNDKPMQAFKSGAALMAYRADVPIIPVYRELRDNAWKRQKVLIGEPIYIKELYGDRIGMPEIEKITELLFQKEQELRDYYRTNIDNGKKKDK